MFDTDSVYTFVHTCAHTHRHMQKDMNNILQTENFLHVKLYSIFRKAAKNMVEKKKEKKAFTGIREVNCRIFKFTPTVLHIIRQNTISLRNGVSS